MCGGALPVRARLRTGRPGPGVRGTRQRFAPQQVHPRPLMDLASSLALSLALFPSLSLSLSLCRVLSLSNWASRATPSTMTVSVRSVICASSKATGVHCTGLRAIQCCSAARWTVNRTSRPKRVRHSPAFYSTTSPCPPGTFCTHYHPRPTGL